MAEVSLANICVCLSHCVCLCLSHCVSVCVNLYLSYVCVCLHTRVQCLWRPEEGVDLLELELQEVRSGTCLLCLLETARRSSGRTACALD